MSRLLAAMLFMAGATQVQAAQLRTQTWSRQVTDEDHLDVTVGYGAGKLTMERGEPGLLYRALFDYDESHATPELEYGNGRLEIGIDATRSGRFGTRRAADSSLDVRLPGEVSMDLRLNLGAAEADIDLSGIPIRRLEFNTGASRSRVRIDEPNPERMASAEFKVGAADLDIRGLGNLRAERVEVKAGVGSVTLGLGGEWPRDARVSVDIGLGALEVRVPSDLGVRIRRDGVLATIEADGFDRDGRTYRSRNWDTAERRIQLDISAALGDVDIVRVP